MAAVHQAKPVKLIVGLLGGDPDLIRRTRQLLVRTYGAADFESPLWPFTQTDYYTDEMGTGLQRAFLAFERLIRPEELAEIKRVTNELEAQIAEEALDPLIRRPVNIDPGYVHLAKLVLATTKDRAHRVFIGQGIYAEVTLQYASEAWQVQPWTYPDYREPHYHAFFSQVRTRLHEQLTALRALVEESRQQKPAEGDWATGAAPGGTGRSGAARGSAPISEAELEALVREARAEPGARGAEPIEPITMEELEAEAERRSPADDKPTGGGRTTSDGGAKPGGPAA
jgi:hypothetical protein